MRDPQSRIMAAQATVLLILIGVTAVCLTACGIGRNSEKKISFEGKTYTLTFSDDFDTLDSRKWAYCPEEERQDAGGEWRNACIAVETGKLVITCDIAEDGTPVSGGIRSTKAHKQTYGLYHIRFKIEKADGLWYAFWLLSDEMFNPKDETGAADGAELDVFEVVPHNEELYMSIHWDGYGENRKSCSKSIAVDDAFYDDYHQLWYVWDRDGYRLYLDGADEGSLLFDLPGEESGGGTCAVPVISPWASWEAGVIISAASARVWLFRKCVIPRS